MVFFLSAFSQRLREDKEREEKIPLESLEMGGFLLFSVFSPDCKAVDGVVEWRGAGSNRYLFLLRG